jgi:hypothetical protein
MFPLEGANAASLRLHKFIQVRYGATCRQLNKCSDDLSALFLQRSDLFPKILLGNRNNLERVQSCRGAVPDYDGRRTAPSKYGMLVRKGAVLVAELIPQRDSGPDPFAPAINPPRQPLVVVSPARDFQ